MLVSGDLLTLNANVREGGSVRVELLDENGDAVEGFALQNCIPLRGNGVAQEVRWQGDHHWRNLAGQKAALRIALVAADLFAVEQHSAD